MGLCLLFLDATFSCRSVAPHLKRTSHGKPYNSLFPDFVLASRKSPLSSRQMCPHRGLGHRTSKIPPKPHDHLIFKMSSSTPMEFSWGFSPLPLLPASPKSCTICFSLDLLPVVLSPAAPVKPLTLRCKVSQTSQLVSESSYYICFLLLPLHFTQKAS